MKRIIYFLSMVFLLVSCTENSKNTTLEEKGRAQSALLLSFQKADSLRQTGAMNIELYKRFIDQAVAFYEEYPEESITPEMLQNAGVSSMTVAKFIKEFNAEDESGIVEYAKKGIEIFDLIQKVYPDYEGAKKAYLNRGIIYDDILGDYKSAEYEYMEYITKYPHDSISVNLRYYIQYLGKTPEEIIAEFGIDSAG